MSTVIVIKLNVLAVLSRTEPRKSPCRSSLLNGRAAHCCIAGARRHLAQSSIAAVTSGQTARCPLPPSEPAPRSRRRRSHYPHSA